MICKKIKSLAASTIKLFIIVLTITETHAYENKLKIYENDKGILSIMYHRFDEFEYPSTNIGMTEFKKQIEIIKDNNLKFLNPKNFSLEIIKNKDEKKILLTIDDAFESFYINAWPYLREKKIPFILFVSTEPIGKKGYMNWEQIKDIQKYDFVKIGNHSHSHEYLVNYTIKDFKKDINLSIKIFKDNLGYNPIFFSYPFGEYSFEQKKFIMENFNFAFGQQSGVIDANKDYFELPRFPINEKYGDLDRFSFLIKLKPLEFKKINIKDMLLSDENNPPNLNISFFEEQSNLNMINCFSNEGEDWKKTNIKLVNKNLSILFSEKFLNRRGRINCSMKDEDGWRWFGLQFTFTNN